MEPPIASALPPARILVVDDNPANLVALEAILVPLGHVIVRAQSGDDALRELLDGDFAVILMDVQMPGMSGLETVARIKQRQRTRRIPVLFLTAAVRDPTVMSLGYAQGAVDYLLKPFEPEILRSKVAVFVELYQQARTIQRQQEELRQRELDALVRHSEARFRTLVDSLEECLWAASEDGTVLYWNRAWCEYTGLSPSESRERQREVVHPEDRDTFERAWSTAIAEGVPTEAEYRLLRARDGAWRWHSGRVFPERDGDGRILGWIGAALDVEVQHQAGEARARVLAREQEARRVAEEASRAKDEFLAIVSHELRAPLNAIVGWSDLLRRGQLDGEQQAKAVATIARNAWAQTELVEDLLDLSRIVSGKLRLERAVVDLREVAGAAVETVRPAAERKGIELALVHTTGDEGEAPLVDGDRERLQQVVWNLTSNAIKFTPEGGRVRVEIERKGPSVSVAIADNGVGIAREFLPHVFDRFRQAETTSTRSHGGLGLGLSIARHLVELHGGSVAVDSEGPGRGTTVTVTLPAATTARPAVTPRHDDEERARPEIDAAAPLASLSVLVVDDEEDSRELLAQVLTLAGANVTCASSVAEALEALRKDRPRIILSDIGMPGQDGYDLMRSVRGDDAWRDIPAVALTGFARREDVERAHEAGFREHLAKPVSPRELVRTLREILDGETHAQDGVASHH